MLPANGETRMVPIDRVRPSTFNPRKNFEQTERAKAELEELAASIREKGLVQPIVVRPLDGNYYEIVAGERRWRASQKASLHVVPVVVRSLTDQEALELAIIENVQRSDLNAIEEAAGYRQLIDSFNYTQDELGQIIGKSRSHLANTMRLLKLPESVQALVRDGLLSAGHARALVGHEDAEVLAKEIVDKGLNVREVEALVMGRKSGAAPSTPKHPGAERPGHARRRAGNVGRTGAFGGYQSGKRRGRRDRRSLQDHGAVRDDPQSAAHAEAGLIPAPVNLPNSLFRHSRFGAQGCRAGNIDQTAAITAPHPLQE